MLRKRLIKVHIYLFYLEEILRGLAHLQTHADTLAYELLFLRHLFYDKLPETGTQYEWKNKYVIVILIKLTVSLQDEYRVYCKKRLSLQCCIYMFS